MGRKNGLNLRGDPEAVIEMLRAKGFDPGAGLGVNMDRLAGGEPPPADAPAPAAKPARRRSFGRWRRWVVAWVVPVRLKSEANMGGRLRDHLARKTEVKEAVRTACPLKSIPVDWAGGWRVKVSLTRVGRNRFDSGDNNQRALKPVKDVVADLLGVDDAHPLLRWAYSQRPGWEPAVLVRVAAAAPPPAALEPTGEK